MPRRGLRRRWRRRATPGRRWSGSPSTPWPGSEASGVARSRICGPVSPPFPTRARTSWARRSASPASSSSGAAGWTRHAALLRPMLSTGGRARRAGLVRTRPAPRVRARAPGRLLGGGGAPARRVGRAVRARSAGVADVRAVPCASGRGAGSARRGGALGGGGDRPGGRGRCRLGPARSAAGARDGSTARPRPVDGPPRACGGVWAHTRAGGGRGAGRLPGGAGSGRGARRAGRARGGARGRRRLPSSPSMQEHPWGLATAKRCEGMIGLASEHGARRPLSWSRRPDAYERLGLRFDCGQSRCSRSAAAQRRHRKWGAARRSLERARRAFAELGSPGWADETRAELARVGARRPQPSGRADPGRAAGRGAGRGRAREQGDRPGTVRVREDGRRSTSRTCTRSWACARARSSRVASRRRAPSG